MVKYDFNELKKHLIDFCAPGLYLENTDRGTIALYCFSRMHGGRTILLAEFPPNDSEITERLSADTASQGIK